MPKRPLPENVTEKLKLLPPSPGCYLHKGEGGEILYVGKAINLRNRVRSYFQGSTKHGARIARMVSKVRDVEWIVVDSELEALVLECNLIKRHRPPFNVRMRDDKSYPYIAITKEAFPRVMFTRKPRQDGGRYFGPYTSAFAVRDTLQTLHKVFPLIPCGKSWSGREEQRPCLYYHLGRCLGPCAGLAKKEEYAAVVDKVERFLKGKEESVVDDMRAEMEAAAEVMDFERAAKLRDGIKAMEHTLQKQKVLSADESDQDVIAVVKDERGAAIQMLYVRGGKLIGQRQYMLDGAGDVAPGHAVQQFVKQYYAEAPDVPREILLPVEIEERNIVQSWLRGRRGSAVTIGVPQGGEKLKLVEMAASNAEQALASFAKELAAKQEWTDDAYAQLQESLSLPTPPIRVEGYDISNTQGSAPTGSMVVTENGEPAKAEYRRFKVRWHPETPNDYAMMHEVITRRLHNYLEGDEKFSRLPDVIMVDGGKLQLSAALKARDELGLTVPMVGLAKRHELLYVAIERDQKDGDLMPPPVIAEPGEIGDALAERLSGGDEMILATHEDGEPKPNPCGTRERGSDPRTFPKFAPKTYDYREVMLPLNSPGLLLLRRLRDEAHRFALTYHRKVRDKRMNGSSLDEIPGVGPRRRRMLLRTFGSIEAIRRATPEEIASVPTMTKTLAGKVKEFLND